MLSLCFNHVATVATPFRSSVFYLLVKLSKICEIFLLHKNVNVSSHRKDKLVALTAVYQFELQLKVRNVPSKLPLLRQGP